MQKQKTKNKRVEAVQTTRLYLLLIVTSVIIMIVSAFVTYGNNAKVINILPGTVKEKMTKEDDSNDIKIVADLSKVPTDKEIEKILNNVIPNICDDCEDDILDCLDEYKINKVLVQNKGYENQLFIELLTGKYFEKKYVVVIDLDTREILNKNGDIDEDECIDKTSESAKGDEIMLDEGSDPDASEYIDVEPRK